MTPTIVVVGASSGIGRATAHAYAARGVRLVLAARSEQTVREAARECRERGAEVLAVPVDVTDEAAVRDLAKVATDAYGRIDVWVQTAAVMAYGRFEDLPADVFRRVVETELFGVVHAARAVLPVLRRQPGGGAFVVANSVLATIATPYMSAYVTSKWALRGFLRTLELESRGTPVRIRSVLPGAVDTPIYRQAANYTGLVAQPPPPVDSPEKAAAAVLRAADSRRHELSVGYANRVIRLGFSLVPSVYDRLVGPLMRFAGLSGDPLPPTDGNVFTPRPEYEGLRPPQSPAVGAGPRV